ncbi:ribonuclease R [Geothermobacter hydrogeniphilus]|uniref:Ribonuclease R n=2 Tax=Geothermobacter hydrogeniphilus TaxID=1969733 RepID=A0A2K2H7G2_9BACT|nr:ribonuclease R [Geothermobacter hydrogeniphilus]
MRRSSKQKTDYGRRVLMWLTDNPGAHAAGEIGRQVGVRRHERRHFLALLADLADRGLLERLKGDRYRLAARKRLEGVLSLHRDGYGFLQVDNVDQPDVFLPARELRETMAGDRLAVVAWRDSRGRYEGRVERILARAHSELVGVYQRGRRENLVVPLGKDPVPPLVIPRGEGLQAAPGQVVIAAIRVYPQGGQPPRGRIMRILGDLHDPEVELLVAAHRFNLPHQFSPEALAVAESVPQAVAEEDCAGRRDLRQLPFVTIDGATARDFDDAVCVEETADGYLLRVAIADVAHYVRPGTPLDRDARERGTSVYFPGRCLPMLPETLSNGICSLNPGVDRLVLVAEMGFSVDGRPQRAGFYRAVIRSAARLTYRQVQKAIDGELPSRQEGLEQLPAMVHLAEVLHRQRVEQGSLDLDLPEAEVVLDLRGRPEAIIRSERLFAHRIIEEFMLAANQAVAGFLEERRVAFPYRIHEPPAQEKILSLQHYLAHFGLGLNLSPDGPAPGDFHDLLRQADDPVTARIINQALLQAMKQARYAVDNAGHFGLGMECYCHFTSPIRRYPDLLVHRVLHREITRDRGEETACGPVPRRSTLETLCEQLSRAERRAMEAERDQVQLKKCQYMEKKIGDTFHGVVASVRSFGMFIELEEVFVEGLLHVSALEDDLYHFEEDLQRLVGYNRHRIFQVGDHLEIRVARVDQEARQIDFVLRETP